MAKKKSFAEKLSDLQKKNKKKKKKPKKASLTIGKKKKKPVKKKKPSRTIPAEFSNQVSGYPLGVRHLRTSVCLQ